MWLGALQQSLDSVVSDTQACSSRAFLDRELTGNKDVAGSPTDLDSEVSDPQACSLRAFLQGVNLDMLILENADSLSF